MEKKGGQRDKAQRGGASEHRPGPAAPGGSFPAPTLLCSLLHGLLPLLLRSGRHNHRRALAFPLSWPPHFLGSAFGRALPQEPDGGAGPFPASLSLHPLCPPGRADVLGATCRVVSVPQTGHRPLTSGLCCPPLSRPVLPAIPPASPATSPLPSLLLRPSPLGCALLAPLVFRVLALL